MHRPLVFGLGLLCAGGCPIVGDGDLTIETRTIDDPIRRIEVFDGLAVDVALDPELAQGVHLEVRGDANLMERIITELHSTDVLGLGLTATSETRPSTAPEVSVATASVAEAYVSGASTLTLQGLISGDLTLDGRDRSTIEALGALETINADLRDGSALTLEGAVATVALVTADAATVDASALTAGDVTLEHGSSENVRLCASGTISGSITGSGDLVLLCAPASIEVDLLGHGSIVEPPTP